MSLNERLISVGAAACTTDTTDVFGDGSGIALYTMDYDASDASGSYDGTPTDVEFGVEGQINYGAGFNGSSSYISTGINVSTTLMTSRSYSFWFKQNSNTNNSRIFGGVNAGVTNNGMFRIREDNGDINYYSINNGVYTWTTTLTNGVWTHVALTDTGSLAKLYINGVEITSPSTTTYTTTTNTNLQIGRGRANSGSITNYANGSIDQVRIFNKSLSSSEVSTLYTETACVYTCTTDTVDYPTTNVAYYKLDNSAEDETGIYDGTPANINYAFGRFGQAAVFNGSSSYIDIDNISGISGASSEVSISTWFNFSGASGDRFIISLRDGCLAEIGFNSGYSPRKLEFKIFDGGNKTVLVDESLITNNNWHHIVLTAESGGLLTAYLDGVSQGTTSIGTISNVTQNNTIGGYNISGTVFGYFDGLIDQVRIFDSALTSTQVESLYNEKPCEDTSTFQPVLYTGNGSTQYISNVGFEPDLVWLKRRDVAANHRMLDSVRGDDLEIYPNLTNAEANFTTLNWGFEANGFSFNTSDASYNASGGDYVAWVFKGGGDSVLNQVGDIDSQVSANTAAGFSIVKWTGNNLASQTIGHGLSSTPEITIIKKLTGTALDWQVNLNSSITGTEGYLNLNLTVALYTTFPNYYTSANSTVLSTNGTTTAERQYNNQSADYIAYCFHSVAGYSKIGSYDGSGSTQSIYVTDDDTSTGSGGFQPSFVMIKNIDAAANWMMYDAVRDSDGTINLFLEANTSDAEASAATATISPISNGFTIGNSNSIHINDSTDTYIYMAFK